MRADDNKSVDAPSESSQVSRSEVSKAKMQKKMPEPEQKLCQEEELPKEMFIGR